MNYYNIAYSIYIPATIGLTFWIAKSLHKNTKAFLTEKFRDNDALAVSTNNLIQTGFYLIALGFSFMRLRIKGGASHYDVNGKFVWEKLETTQGAIEQLASKLGAFTLVLGLLLFINFFIMLMIQKPKKQLANN